MKPARRWAAPEVVQTSAMDCGPATLKCLLQGHGVNLSYDRLREACQTDVDGTTIDTMEEIALALGLQAEQVLLPLDHVLLPGAQALPCIAVVRLPGGDTHFVVLWRRYGALVEVMDPAMGRRWLTRDALLAELYQHKMQVPAADWRTWAASEEFLRPLRERLSGLGLERSESARRVAAALDDASWQGLGSLDAATRLAASLVRGGALRRGPAAGHLIGALLGEGGDGTENQAASALLDPHRHVQAAPVEGDDDDGEEQVLIRGAVLVRCAGLRAEALDPAELPAELAGALAQPATRPLRELWRLLALEGRLAAATVLLASAASAAAVVLEALLFFTLLGLGERLVLGEQRWVASAALAALLAAALVLEGSLGSLLWRAGRHLELRLRTAFLEKIPRLSDRHFQSRLVSDMAERAHLTYLLRELPDLAGQALRTLLELVFTAAAIVWLLDGAAMAWAVAAVLLAVALPAAAQPLLQGRDLKWRTHGGALSRFHLDALLGLVPIRSHSAQDAFRRAHESLLVEWARAGLALQRLSTGVDAVQWTVGLGLVAWLVLPFRGAQDFPAALLLLYWALKMPLLSHELASVARRYPGLHNLTLRLLEPLSAVDATTGAAHEGGAGSASPAPPESATAPARTGMAVVLEGVDVRIAGHAVLHDLRLQLSPGEHVAVVGVSGAGKSALLGLLLGWHQPSGGVLQVDGSEVDGALLDRLRRETAWVDPAVHLWNRSLHHNLCYGAEPGLTNIDPSLTAAGLKEVLQRLPEGLQTALGEGGTLLSGGEGQRVRVGRALLRDTVRLVLLDEPFRGLARDERVRLLAHVRAQWAEATLLFVTHDVAQAQGFGRVLVMHEGRLVEDGSPAALTATPHSRYADLLAHDAQAQAGLWNDASWRRLWLEDGQLVESGGAR